MHELYRKALDLPADPGIYRMLDAGGKIIYIGKAKRLRNRVSSYFKPGADHQPKVEKMVSHVDTFEVIVVNSEFEALVLECSQIKMHMPKYNILLKDDKGFSYIRISDEPYPRITAELQKRNDGARYLGPYMSSFGVRQMVETANTAFRLPTCKKTFPRDFGRARPCLNAHMGRCMAVCTGKVSEEEYRQNVDSAIELLTKGSDAILEELKAEMYAASENLEFERAAKLRDSINAIEKMSPGQKVVGGPSALSTDVFGFAADERSVCAVVIKYRNGKLYDKEEKIIGDTTDIPTAREEFVTHYYLYSGEIPDRILVDAEFDSMELFERYLAEIRGRNVKVSVPKRGSGKVMAEMAYSNAADRLRRTRQRKTKTEAALGELANLLGLEKVPERIEAYDISNYGEEKSAGMTVFVHGQPKRSDYRHFYIKTVEGVDDYASMTEVLLRRVARFDGGSAGFAERPDLILLDGGQGHVNTIAEALKDTSFRDVPLFGMVKNSKHRTRGIVSPEGELEISAHRNAFALVTAVQDETHRYSIEFQRKSHSRNGMRSTLLEIDGIGETRAKALLKHFKTAKAISEASEEELAAVKGISRAAAAAVFRYYHGS